jgi:hypothetical protein
VVFYVKAYQHPITLKSIPIAVVYSASRISIGAYRLSIAFETGFHSGFEADLAGTTE